MNHNVIEAIIAAAKLTKSQSAALRVLLNSDTPDVASQALSYVLKHDRGKSDIPRIERYLGSSVDPVQFSGIHHSAGLAKHPRIYGKEARFKTSPKGY